MRIESLALVLSLSLGALACSKAAPATDATSPPSPSPPPPAPGKDNGVPNASAPPAAPGAMIDRPQGGSFDGAAAARALGKVDLSGCGAKVGAAGRVTMTFAPDGSGKASLDPPGFDPPIANCITARFNAVRIPAFEGAPVKTGKSFIVGGD